MIRKIIQIAIQVFIFSFFSSAWGACEAEIENAVEAAAVITRPSIERARSAGMRVNSIEQVNAGRRKEFLEFGTYFARMDLAERKRWLETVSSELSDAQRSLKSQDVKNSDVAYALAKLCLLKAASGGPTAIGDQGGGQRTNQSQANQQSQQSQQTAQQQSQQAQQNAQQSQARADQQRQGKRKTNDPAAQAHECVAIDQAGSGNFGAFKNTCGYKVNFTTCNYKPRTIQGGFNWSADFNCEKQQFGLHTPDSGRSVAAHNRNTEMVYWFACKAPATPVDAEFVVGKGIEARCHN